MCLPYVSSFQEGRIESIWPKQRECEVMKRELERGRQAETILYWVSAHEAEGWVDRLGSGNYYCRLWAGQAGWDLIWIWSAPSADGGLGGTG